MTDRPAGTPEPDPTDAEPTDDADATDAPVDDDTIAR